MERTHLVATLAKQVNAQAGVNSSTREYCHISLRCLYAALLLSLWPIMNDANKAANLRPQDWAKSKSEFPAHSTSPIPGMGYAVYATELWPRTVAPASPALSAIATDHVKTHFAQALFQLAVKAGHLSFSDNAPQQLLGQP